MRSDVPWTRAAACIGVVLLIGGCGTSPESSSVAYKEAESVQSLEVPPDLTRPSSSDAVQVPGEGAGGSIAGRLLPDFDGIRFVRVGVNTWLEIDETQPETLWPRVDGFLTAQGLTVTRREPNLGIIETGWAERQDGPSRGGIGGFINNIFGLLGPDSIRDKYTIRLERLEQGAGTRVFLTHHAAQEVDTGPGGQVVGDYEWARLGGNPAIEAEMTRRLLVHLGVTEARASGIVADTTASLGAPARYVVDGGAASVMIDSVDARRTFARVGDGLGELGADILETDRDRGRYVLEWTPPEEFADGGLFGWFGSDEPEPVEMQLLLRPADAAIRVKAADARGTIRSTDVHRALLRRLAVALGADPAEVQRAEEADDAEGLDRSESQQPLGPDQ